MSSSKHDTPFYSPTCPQRLADYIVVFKKTATADQINKYADEVSANGEWSW